MDDSVPGSGPAAASSTRMLSDRRFWKWTTIGLGAIAFAKGIREPNSWSYTQAQLNYSVGFMRRGLFGAALGGPLGLNRYSHFAVFSTLLLAVLFGALTLIVYKTRLAERTPPGELIAVYASSYSVSYLAHLNGYLDIPLALLCLAPLFLRSTGWRLAAATVCTTLGILIHEQFFFAFVPVLIAGVLFGAATGHTPAQKRLGWAGGIGLAVLSLGLTGYLGRYCTISEAQAERLQRSIEIRTNGPLQPEVLKVLPRTPRQNTEIMKSVWARPTFLPVQVEGLLLFGPTTAVLSWATFLLLRRWTPNAYRWLYVVALLATLSPLSLHLVGWDKNRWNELLCLNAFLLLLMVSRLAGGEPVQLPLRLRRACLVVMLLNMATGGGMMDGRHIRPFPFMRSPDAAQVEPYQPPIAGNTP